MTRVKAADVQSSQAGGAKKKSCIGADTSPDWHYWRQMPHEVLWKVVALSCNIEPRRERLADSNYWINRARWGGTGQDDRYREFHDRLEIATARISELDVASVNMSDANEDRIKLPEFAAWALSIGWETPLEFAGMAKKVDSGAVIGAVQNDRAMRTGVDTDKSLGTRERDSLLKLVIGMAVKGYSYDPAATRSDAVADIGGDLEALGISLDSDTVRKWLKQGAELLPAKPDKA